MTPDLGAGPALRTWSNVGFAEVEFSLTKRSKKKLEARAAGVPSNPQKLGARAASVNTQCWIEEAITSLAKHKFECAVVICPHYESSFGTELY